MFCWLVSDEAANFGTLLTGITAVIAALVAWRQFSAWRDQQISLKKAEVAGRFYVVVSNLMEAIKTLTSPFAFKIIDDMTVLTDPEKHLEVAYKKQTMVHEYVKSFNDSRSEAEVYLDDDLVEQVEELWTFYTEIHLGIFYGLPEAMEYGRSDQEQELRKFIYEDSKASLERFEISLREPLKQTARMGRKESR